MKRRNFVKTSAAAVGLLASMKISPLQASKYEEYPKTESFEKDNRSPEYLSQIKKKGMLSKPELAANAYPISPLSLTERIKQKVVPQHGFCSIMPGNNVREALISGNGTMRIELMGDPYAEQILFHHESLMMPWEKPIEAPNVAHIFSEMRQLVLDGKNAEATALAIKHMNESQIKQDTEPHPTVPAFLMKLDLPKTISAKNYLRTVNFENSEIKVMWTDEKGSWLRQTFASRPDNVIVQKLVAPAGKKMDVRISLEKSSGWSMVSGMDWGAKRGIGTTDPDMKAFQDLTEVQKKFTPKGVEANDILQESNVQMLIYKCHLDPTVDNSGFAGITRVIYNGGSAKTEGADLVIENAESVLLLTRIDYFADFTDNKVTSIKQDVEKIEPNYHALLDKHQKVQSEMLSRVTVDFGGTSQYAMSTEEILADQLTRSDFSAVLLEKIFEMGRYWFIINSGKYPAIATGVNSTINLQTAGAIQGDLREGMEAYFRWMEEIAPDCRNNARNIFGFRGASYPLFPDKGIGKSFYYTNASEIGIWPYWISAGGWCIRHFWDHYLVTGDLEFLRNRVVPAYKDLAAFYEDFLSITDKNGNYIFVPSISPENTPTKTNSPGPSLINAAMDIAVCREVLMNLVTSCETLGIESAGIARWKAMLDKMPPYLMEPDGTLKEWSWPSLKERYNHRHISHLYGAWPGDEIDPDRTPLLARAAEIADRKRTFDAMSTSVAGETLAAYTRCHRALVGARLKDNIIVDVQLRQLIEQGYISNALRCSREPYSYPIPDAQAGIPAILMEMLVYSRPGVIEVFPALPSTLKKGTLKGLLVRTFARINRMTWDLEARTADITITSLRKQDITLMARYGIEDITAPSGVLGEFSKGKANCKLHLPENKAIEIHLKLGHHNPMEWLNHIIY